MSKFHIGKNGRPSACKAKTHCPLGGPYEHARSKEEVQEILDSYNETLSKLEKGVIIKEQNDPFITAGQIKALKERNNKISLDADAIEKRNKRIDALRNKIAFSSYEDLKEIVKEHEQRSQSIVKNLAILTQENERIDSQLKEIETNSPFGKRLQVTKTGKLFVQGMAKTEWGTYKKLNEERNALLEERLALKRKYPTETKYSEAQIQSMRKDIKAYEDFDKENPKEKLTQNRINEYNENLEKIKKLERVYNDQLFEKRTNLKFNTLSKGEEGVDLSDKVKYVNGKPNNLYIKDKGVYYKVIDQESPTKLEVESMSGERGPFYLTSTYNWRVHSSPEKRKAEIPDIYIDESSDGQLGSEIGKSFQYSKHIYYSDD